MQRIILTREISLIHLRRADQAAIESIGPAMVGTLNSPRKLSLGGRAHACAAVTTDVVESAQGAGGVAGNNDAFAAYIAQEILAGFAKVFGSSGADPAMEVESLYFLPE